MITFSREEKQYLSDNQNYELLGRIVAAQKAKDEKTLENLKTQVNELRGIRDITPAESYELGKKLSKQLLPVFSARRAQQKAFRAGVNGEPIPAE